MKPPPHSPQDSDRSMAGSHSNEAEIIEEHPASAKHRLYAIAGLLALSGVVFFSGLGALALLGPDEPRYAEVAREMFFSADYISPKLCGCLWFEKPVLFYWLASGSYYLLGVSEFSARFPSALTAALSALFLGWVISRRLSARLGFVISFVLISSGLFVAYARAATPDMLLAASMSAALISGYAMAVSDRLRTRIGWLLFASAATGLSVLAKGLVGVVLIVVILGLYFAITGRLRTVSWRWWMAGFATFLIVAAIWYVPVTVEHGRAFIDQFFIEHHFKRYVSNRFYHPQPIYFYPAVALFGMTPWTFFLIAAVRRIRKLRPRRDRRDLLLALAWIWVAAPTIFFSFSGSKLPGYILPIFPALAIIAGVEVERFWRGERSRGLTATVWITAAGLIFIGAGTAVYLLHEDVNAAGWRWLLLSLPPAVALTAAGALAASKRKLFLLASGALVASIVFGATTLLFPKMNDEWSRKRLALEAAAALRPGEKIGFFIYKEYSPVFYAEGRVECGQPEGDILNALREDRLASALEGKSSMVVITLERWRKGLEEDGRFDMEFIGSQEEAQAYRIKLKN